MNPRSILFQAQGYAFRIVEDYKSDLIFHDRKSFNLMKSGEMALLCIRESGTHFIPIQYVRGLTNFLLTVNQQNGSEWFLVQCMVESKDGWDAMGTVDPIKFDEALNLVDYTVRGSAEYPTFKYRIVATNTLTKETSLVSDIVADTATEAYSRVKAEVEGSEEIYRLCEDIRNLEFSHYIYMF